MAKLKGPIETIKDEFFSLTLEEQRDILWAYSAYVEDFPEDHDGDSYPVSFLEWFTNDMDIMYPYGIAATHMTNGEPVFY